MKRYLTKEQIDSIWGAGTTRRLRSHGIRPCGEFRHAVYDGKQIADLLEYILGKKNSKPWECPPAGLSIRQRLRSGEPPSKILNSIPTQITREAREKYGDHPGEDYWSLKDIARNYPSIFNIKGWLQRQGIKPRIQTGTSKVNWYLKDEICDKYVKEFLPE